MDQKPMHRFCHDDIPGANWRLTQFAATVPNSCVCSICGMIPKWLVKLPCSHALCPACHGLSSKKGSGLCPLDKQSFEITNSVTVHIDDSEVRSFKVYCWNEVHGCQYVGSMEHLLWHYEHECRFHVVECLRCHRTVLHNELLKHHENGCGATSSHSAEESLPSESASVTPGDSLEDPRMLLQDPHSGLPAITALLNKVVEHAKRHEVWFNTCTSDFKASILKFKRDIAQMSNVVSSTPSCANAAGSSLSPELESALVLQKLEHLAYKSTNQLELMRQIVTQPAGHQSVIVDCKPLDYFLDRYRRLSNALSTEDGLSNEISRLVYALRFENAENLFSCALESKKLAAVSVPLTRDTYFTIVVSKSTASVLDTGTLHLDIEFNGLLEDSVCVLSDWSVRVKHPDSVDLELEGPHESGDDCTRTMGKYVHFHHRFSVELDSVRSGGFLNNSCLTLEIQFDEA
ncbi:uncharacterized protein LOC142803494 [Rhipicephalus microplus]|uniref:uncharacterized protein LOC142803494 n=1 Tax=Rhipicephalus microplus TaxID=6941 RepID=UPI003F6D028F